ncbi:MAG: radical SAM protein [Anaerovoracaceae bacterium]|jgi:MoaA/NifB/PqqE/SkfB family radical SAM enzyme
MSVKAGVEKAVLNSVLNWTHKDPETRVPKLMDRINSIMGRGENTLEKQRMYFTKWANDKSSPWHKMMMDVLGGGVDYGVVKKLFDNFFLNANLIGWKRQCYYREKYGCNVPWAVLLDPTSACNLHCTGCWAAEYGNRLNLTFEDIDSIIRQGKQLGIFMYIYTGGEPLVRKKDLIKLCEKHSDCVFLSFTNGTLIDEEFADELLRVKNFVPAISVEGFEETTDLRRGKGTYQKVEHAMALLKERHLPFGISCCYTSQNVDTVTSEAYIDKMVDWGALFVWFFHYMPVGAGADTSLLLTPEQRETVYHKLRSYRGKKPIMEIDFQNDGEYIGGCIAGGKRYMHINAAGDADPCVFIHYSDSNIHEKTLLEVLTSPLFMAYHDGQPFNDNHLRPCPMLENPEKIVEMVHKSGAHSTDPEQPESVEDLTAKTKDYARRWQPTADRLWETSHGTEIEEEKEEEDLENEREDPEEESLAV